MEWTLASTFWSGICIAIALLVLGRIRKKACVHSRHLPPGPPGWPIVGNMFDLGEMPHKSLADLSIKYGPVVWLQLGTLKTMVFHQLKQRRNCLRTMTSLLLAAPSRGLEGQRL
ncbi:hypothetical protein IFM89_011661 [Coptis chinensis]|uniref:Cytochrome P450 n=1 Tax=Coptis chinensis TaxID=261450 RepID=A0A835HVA3_9MAGN|nr:hypothetical protein IFM89_011661 [Coptis chinensis]